MSKATDEIKKIAEQTDRILLFHSATGKDSIALLDLCVPYFEKITCVFMYIVKNMDCVNRYIKWAEARYNNVHFIQCPHFALSSYVRNGFLGCAQNEKQKILNLADITDIARKQTGIEWAVFGMKEADSLNRRVFLRRTTQENGGNCINFKTKKAYPLHLYKHKDIVKYIQDNNLIKNQEYGSKTSSSEHPANAVFLKWLSENFPKDLQKVFAQFPESERILNDFTNNSQYETDFSEFDQESETFAD